MNHDEERSHLLSFDAPHWSGPAAPLVVATLPQSARRCMRATCRAGCSVVDGCVHSMVVPSSSVGYSAITTDPRGLVAARFPSLRSLCCSLEHRAALPALQELGPQLTSLTLMPGVTAWLERDEELSAVAATLATCTRLARLDLQHNPGGSKVWDAIVGLPALTWLGVSAAETSIFKVKGELGRLLSLPWHNLAVKVGAGLRWCVGAVRVNAYCSSNCMLRECVR